MTADDPRHEILAAFRDGLGIVLPSTSTDVIAARLVDSLALVTLIAEVEERLDVEIPFESLDLDNLRSVDAIADLVTGLRSEAA